MLCARSTELQNKQTKQRKTKTSVDRQTLCALLLDLIIGKSGNLIFKTSKEKLCNTRNKKIYCGDGVSSNFLAVMRCLLNFFCGVAVFRALQSPPRFGSYSFFCCFFSWGNLTDLVMGYRRLGGVEEHGVVLSGWEMRRLLKLYNSFQKIKKSL